MSRHSRNHCRDATLRVSLKHECVTEIDSGPRHLRAKAITFRYGDCFVDEAARIADIAGESKNRMTVIQELRELPRVSIRTKHLQCLEGTSFRTIGISDVPKNVRFAPASSAIPQYAVKVVVLIWRCRQIGNRDGMCL